MCTFYDIGHWNPSNCKSIGYPIVFNESGENDDGVANARSRHLSVIIMIMIFGYVEYRFHFCRPFQWITMLASMLGFDFVTSWQYLSIYFVILLCSITLPLSLICSHTHTHIRTLFSSSLCEREQCYIMQTEKVRTRILWIFKKNCMALKHPS